MLRKVESHHAEARFAEPTPLGLIGLAIGCAALTPIAFGLTATPAAFRTAALFCLLFGGGCQLVSGVLNFANKNLYGGTLLTAFAFQWFFNYWVLDSLADGVVPDHSVVFATEVISLVIFSVFTYGFGFYSKVLFVFLLDIDILYVAKVINGIGETHALDPLIAICTVALGAISLWIAFVLLINPAAGRAVFPVSGPMFKATPPPSFDFARRRAIFGALYERWQEHAFEPMPWGDLEAAVDRRLDGAGPLLPDACYLMERGALVLDDPKSPQSARLTAAGIDLWEQRELAKPGG